MSEDRSNRFEQAVLGETDQVFRLHGQSDFADAAVRLATQAHRRIDIFTHDLEPLIYNRAEFADAVSALARSNPHTRIQILLRESGTAVGCGHRLLALAQRLASSIQVRKIHSHYASQEQCYLLVDDTGLLYRPHGDSWDGSAEFSAAGRIRELRNEFQDIWERSNPDSELRSL